MDINQCYNLLKYRATKSGFNGTIGPNDFNLIWAGAEQRMYNREYDNYVRNQRISEALTPFKSDPIGINIDGQGKYTKPNDLLHIDAIRHVFDSKERLIQRVEDDRLAEHLSSSYDMPTLQFPIYTEYKAYIQFNPLNLGTGNLVYLKKLVPGVWGYTLVDGFPVYSVGTSVQPLWRDSELDEIIYMALSDAGISMRDQQVEAFSERKIQTNQ